MEATIRSNIKAAIDRVIDDLDSDYACQDNYELTSKHRAWVSAACAKDMPVEDLEDMYMWIVDGQGSVPKMVTMVSMHAHATTSMREDSLTPWLELIWSYNEDQMVEAIDNAARISLPVSTDDFGSRDGEEKKLDDRERAKSI